MATNKVVHARSDVQRVEGQHGRQGRFLLNAMASANLRPELERIALHTTHTIHCIQQIYQKTAEDKCCSFCPHHPTTNEVQQASGWVKPQEH